MSAAAELVAIVEGNGGHIRIDGADLVIRPGEAAEPMLAELRAYKPEIIALLQSRTEQEPDSDALGLWMLERCAFRDRYSGGVGLLHVDLARWCAESTRPAPASRRAFVAALQAEGFAVTADSLVYGLVLKEWLKGYGPCEATPADGGTGTGYRM